MRLTKSQLQEAVATIYGLLSQGKSDKQIMKRTGLTAEELSELKVAMFDIKADEVRTRPPEHVYVEYLINQSQNIRDLTRMIKQFKTTKQYNALVGAIRARAEIYDKLIAKGQEFGLIKKTPERKEIVAGVMVADLSNKELRTAALGELNMLGKLIERFGDEGGDLLSLPAPTRIHRGKPLPSASGAKPKKAKKVKSKTGKVHKGRKRKAPPAPIDVEGVHDG